MKSLSHYIVVRRDLPFGVILSMVAHAAGESFYAFAQPCVSFASMTVASGGYAAPAPSGPSTMASDPLRQGENQTFTIEPIDPAKTIAVVLGARNEGRLVKLQRDLASVGVAFVDIRETEGDFAGQLMAIGLVPGDKRVLAPLVRDFHMFKELEPTS